MNAPTTFDDLTARMKDNFYQAAENIGVSESDIIPVINCADRPDGKFIASGDPDRTHAKMTPRVVENLDRLKDLIGIPDSAFQKGLMGDRHVVYPKIDTSRLTRLCGIADPCDLTDELFAEEAAKVSQAMTAYVNGFSAKVDPRLVALVHTATFPFTYSAGAAKELDVPDGTTHQFDEPNPLGWVYGAVNVGPSGSLAFSVLTHIKCTGVATMQADLPPK